MKLSGAGLGVTRLQNLDEMYPAQSILMQSGQLIQFGAGVFAYNNVPLLLKQNIEKVIREVHNKYNCIEVLFPTLQPESIWQESGRWNKYIEDGTMLVVETEKGNFCLAPTAEEAVTELAKKKIKSYKDLPVNFYQISDKYRNEIRTRGYLLRGKSFVMKDAYSFDKDEAGLVNSYEIFRKIYIEIFERLGIKVCIVVADNGAIGGKKSEEFMVESEFGEDTILYDKVSGKYLNSEILEKPDYATYLKEEYGIENLSQLEEKKAVEIGHIFQLGTTYSTTMNATYADSDGKEKPFYMGCYGIGVSRLLAVMYEKSVVFDKNGVPCGIVLPKNVAPYLVQIVAKTDNAEKFEEAMNLYDTLLKSGISAIIDDRFDVTFGSKIKDVKVLGTPFMAVIGDKVEKNCVELENSLTGEKDVITQEELVERLRKQ